MSRPSIVVKTTINGAVIEGQRPGSSPKNEKILGPDAFEPKPNSPSGDRLVMRQVTPEEADVMEKRVAMRVSERAFKES